MRIMINIFGFISFDFTVITVLIAQKNSVKFSFSGTKTDGKQSLQIEKYGAVS